MKANKFFKAAAVAIAAFALICCCAFAVDPDSSVKEITKPYACTYECTRATLNGEDLLGGYEYLRVTLEKSGALIVESKKQGGAAHKLQGNYTFDDKTRELTANIGILGAVRSHRTVLENGKFTIKMPVMSKQLIMIFEAV